MEFFKSRLCTTFTCCHICRSLQSGLEFRLGIQEIFDDITDDYFECPYGMAYLEDIERIEQIEKTKIDKSKIKAKGCKSCAEKKKKFHEILKKHREALQKSK